MNESRTLTIELSTDDWQLLEAEALKANQSNETLALKILQERLYQKQTKEALDALQKLTKIGDRQAIFDPVQIIREGRE